MDIKYWSLRGYSPRPEQTIIIDKITAAMNAGYKNIILEAGTGIGKSAIATTIARMVDDSYILTMTNQLQAQYLYDFRYMLTEIKGRNNYPCNYGGTCEKCQMEVEEELRCEDCSYLLALQEAQRSKSVISNYDYLFYSGNYAGHWKTRDLLILDEAHNFEKKVMSLVSEEMNRWVIWNRYEFDIFETIMKNKPLKSINNFSYWKEIIEKCIMKEKELPMFCEADEKKRDTYLAKYDRLLMKIDDEDYILDLPLKKDIMKDKDCQAHLKAEFKPLTGTNHSESLLRFGRTRLFLTGTLGNKDKFCEWNGLNADETCHIYVKSPFPVQNRPIIKQYVCSMKQGAWKNEHILKYVTRILDAHKGEKGVIHTSSNEQAWWIKKSLNSKDIWVAHGKTREATIKAFEESKRPLTLIGAGLKDGVDFKGDKCRFQILFKVPFPSLASQQVKRRRINDPDWYAYQTVMSLMQSYGRGVRDVDDWCKYYVLDMDFEGLINEYDYLFNEYFLEAIQ